MVVPGAWSPLWWAPMSTSDVQTLRRIAVQSSTAAGVVVVVAPYLSPRPESERGLYALLGAVLVVKSIILLLARRWPAPVVRFVAVWPDVVVTTVLLGLSSQAGVLPMLLVWPALTSAYFFSRVGAVTVLVGIGVGLTAAGLRSPDERLSVVAWVISMLVCVTSAVTIRVIAERADLLMRRLDERANHDSMTGLLNRRGFDEALDVRWSADPDGRLAVTFFDLDLFKAVNDTYGHATGDAVLAAFADVLRSSCGPGDVVGRTGGEEFAMAMPGRDSQAAHRRAGKVVEAVAGLRVPSGSGPIQVTVSAGTAERQPRHASPAALCRDADRALYSAKDEGRNRALVAASA